MRNINIFIAILITALCKNKLQVDERIVNVIFAAMQPKNPDFKALVEEKFKVNAFSHLMGVRLSSIQYQQVAATLNLTGDLLQQNQVAHGGVLMSLSDIVAGFAAFTVVEKGHHVVTAEIKVSCLRPATGQLLAIGSVVKPGSNIIFCESEVWMQEPVKKLVAKSSSSMAVVRKEAYGKTSS